MNLDEEISKPALKEQPVFCPSQKCICAFQPPSCKTAVSNLCELAEGDKCAGNESLEVVGPNSAIHPNLCWIPQII